MTSLNKPHKPRKNSAFLHLMSIHWWMAGFYLILFMTGTPMAQLPREWLIRSLTYDFHKSIGTLVIALLVWRIVVLLRVWWRKYLKKPPKFTPLWWQKVCLHTTLYIFMCIVPISGLFFSNSFKSNNVKFFGIVLPDMFPENEAMVDLGRNLHFWFAYTFLAFIILHIIHQKKVAVSLWKKLRKRVAKVA
ncbi:MAG: cytochrome b [Okeania sp. SIO2H7]|nr:cytochrome b [Okeania sp. SIO2H7]